MIPDCALAWAWYFDRNPKVVAAWGHQNGRWPMHTGSGPDGFAGARQEYRCDSEDCWCHLESSEGGDEDARREDAGRDAD